MEGMGEMGGIQFGDQWGGGNSLSNMAYSIGGEAMGEMSGSMDMTNLENMGMDMSSMEYMMRMVESKVSEAYMVGMCVPSASSDSSEPSTGKLLCFSNFILFFFSFFGRKIYSRDLYPTDRAFFTLIFSAFFPTKLKIDQKKYFMFKSSLCQTFQTSFVFLFHQLSFDTNFHAKKMKLCKQIRGLRKIVLVFFVFFLALYYVVLSYKRL